MIGFFGWFRNRVKEAVLGGVSDAVDVLDNSWRNIEDEADARLERIAAAARNGAGERRPAKTRS